MQDLKIFNVFQPQSIQFQLNLNTNTERVNSHIRFKTYQLYSLW